MLILVQIGPLMRPGSVLQESKTGEERNFAGAVFPLTLASGLYNSLYYRTSRDKKDGYRQRNVRQFLQSA